MTPTRTGMDRILAGDAGLDGTRFGILTNDAAHARCHPDAPARALLQGQLNSSGQGSLVRVFSPEHGIEARAADGTAVDDSHDNATGLPVVSLYGSRFRPPPATLTDLDAVLFDVPDAGARFYTYLWTLTHLIDACAETGTPVVVLDRPNPQTGDLARTEGPVLDLETCASFLGRLDIPITHQMTLGEMALLWKREVRPEADVHVVPMEGWGRASTWESTGLSFVPPSPALQTVEAVRLYPGLCLFEAFNVSVGRGSDHSFTAIGAPWLKPEEVLEALSRDASHVVDLTPVTFTPSLHPHQGHECEGISISVRDVSAFRPVAFGMHLIRAVYEVHAAQMQRMRYPTAANPTGDVHLARLIGDVEVAARLSTADNSSIRAWTSLTDWERRVAPVLLYP